MMKWVILGIKLTLLLLLCSDALATTVSMSLDEAVTRAISSSATLKKSSAVQRAAEFQLQRARSALAPRVDFHVELGTSRDRLSTPGNPAPDHPRDRNQYGAQLVVSQNVYAGFSDTKALRTAKSIVDKNQLSLGETKAALVRHTVQLYFQIQLLQQQLLAEKEVQRLRTSQLGDLQNRLRVGRATQLEILQARYALQSQTPAIRKLEAEIELATMELARNLGLNLDTSIELTDTLDEAFQTLDDSAIPPLADAYERSLNFNPNLQVLRAENTVTRAELEQGATQHLPRLDLEVRAGVDAHQREEWGERSALTYSGALLLTVPLFSGFSSINERRETLARLQSLSYEETLFREQLLLELSRYYQDWQLALVRYQTKTVNLEIAEESIARADSLYEAGRATTSEVIDAYTLKLQAAQAAAEAKYLRIEAATNVRYLMGQLDEILH